MSLLRTISASELSEIISSHKEWLDNNKDSKRANLSVANLSRANLSRANLLGANLSGADLSGANLSGTNLLRANLSVANLSRANLLGADLSGADLSGANLSGAKGLRNARDFLSQFESDSTGIFVYKTFNSEYSSPKGWIIEENSILVENVNPLPTVDCGCGINIATLEWVKKNNNTNREIWKLHIDWIDLGDCVVPYNTDGKFRVGRATIVSLCS